MFLLVFSLLPGYSQASPEASQADDSTPGQGRILLVLPFDNLTNPTAIDAATVGATAEATEQTNLDWIREAVPEILNSRFTSAGYLPLSREDRLYTLDHLGFPETFQPSRATELRLAQTLDANSIVFGSFAANGTKITFKARIVDVPGLHLSKEIFVSGEISQLLPLLNSLAWQLTRVLDPGFSVAEETFRAAGSKMRLDAFEQYVRGITERDVDERLRHLKKATELDPQFTTAWLAIGRLQFATQKYEDAAISFGRVTRGDPSELEAGFYRGLAQLFSGNYGHAEESFAAVARVLPLPEVVNNEGVSLSRRGKDAVALYRQAIAADPNDPDYHFNLAVSLNRQGAKAEALAEMERCLKQRATDSEARALAEAWGGADKLGPDKTAADAAAIEPLERIKRSYDGAAYRQAALMLEQVETTRLAALPAAQRAASLNRTAHDNLDRGLLLEAEREFQAALLADGNSAEAHAGLAQVRERAGDMDGARTEAHAALTARPTAEAYLVLARIDLAASHLPEAREEAADAVRLDQGNRAARDLRKAIETRIETEQKSQVKPADAAPGAPSDKPGDKSPSPAEKPPA